MAHAHSDEPEIQAYELCFMHYRLNTSHATSLTKL